MMKYSQYSDSHMDEDWNVNIPKTWDKVALKRLCKVTSGSTPKGQPEFWNGEIKWVTPDDLGKNSTKSIFTTNRTITEKGYASCGTELIPKGSVVLSTRAPIGHTAIIEDDMCFNQGCKGLTPGGKVDSSYLYYLIVASKDRLQVLGNGTTFIELSRNAFASYKGIFPSLTEQTQIANFLDHKTGQIDRLIEQKEKLLKLLAEKRTAIITRAVTKGLDPNVEMKDSGIDWLGEIPKHWEVKPLKFVVKLINQKLDELGDLPYMGLEHIESWTSKRIFDENAKADGVVSKFQPKDVLFGKLRPYLAKVYLTDFEGGASTEALVLRSGDEVVPGFLKYYLVSDLLIDVINSSTYGSKMPRASWSFIGRLPMVVPNQNTQYEIVNYLSKEIEKLDKLIHKINESINQLKEYREALITAAVTGQIDVRGEMDIRDNDSTLGGANSHLEHPDIPFNEKHNAKI